jgi:two-component system, NtrC family, response regulator HydG
MEASSAKKQHQGRILVVDDDPAYHEYVRRVLGSGGFDVGHEPDGEGALARVTTEHWDLLITDIRLPGMNGLELLDRVREQFPGLPVAVLTGHALVDYAVSALRGTAAQFLQKPISRPDLIAKAAELIAGRAARERRATGARAGTAESGQPAEAAKPAREHGGVLPRPRAGADELAGTPDDGTRARSAPPGR